MQIFTNMPYTLEMMMPAMEILTLGPCSSLYLRSTPFQKEMTYLLMATLSSPCSLEEADNHVRVFEISHSGFILHKLNIYSENCKKNCYL